MQLSNIKAGTVDMPMPNGGTKPFKLVIVPAEQVEKKTMVSPLNERDQHLLTERALSDILPSVRQYGVSEPVMARDVNGVLEIAKGSRRRACAIHAGVDLPVLVGDLTDEEVMALDRVSNYHLQPSPWERGRRYKKLVDRCGSLRKAEMYLADVGEKVSRRDISRCIATYLLPVEIIAAFDCPNDLSARAGEELGNLWAAGTDELREAWLALAGRFVAGEVEKDEEWDADQTAAAFKALRVGSDKEAKAKPAKVVKSWGDGRIKLTHAGKKASIVITDVDQKVVDYVTRLIAGELQLPLDADKVQPAGDSHNQLDLLSLEYGSGWQSLLEDSAGKWVEEAWGKFHHAIREFKEDLQLRGASEEEIETVEELAEERFRGETNPKVLLNIREIRAIVKRCIEELELPCWQR
ncbi:ParB/RepB/Spo0J family partition protein [Aeromonas hydrophila]|uniref:ParB/RepB/Spo0J family partition protein n=1 Tax=Aeromonas hydrophila TaxID=644 RepID=UPI001FF67A4D|nr:ParB/RepB/Spo0J family partition protein [Aeromonas hydrophila]MCK0187898.1 ParB/RepB/Spo0J family partition protein [Aeromonas hydrophila]UOV94578.1 ParB/RepB/Spo0J family partition protein [Aeromonas hydrophila]